MPEVGDIAEKVRSKNAGPFWLTIDIFCGSKESFEYLRTHLSSESVAHRLGGKTSELKRFDMPELDVIKFSLPRPSIQGSGTDRDMHGAQWANVIAEIELP
ncbi:MAG: DUF4387 family protein [Pseudomonadota bacterium]